MQTICRLIDFSVLIGYYKMKRHSVRRNYLDGPSNAAFCLQRVSYRPTTLWSGASRSRMSIRRQGEIYNNYLTKIMTPSNSVIISILLITQLSGVLDACRARASPLQRACTDEWATINKESCVNNSN